MLKIYEKLYKELETKGYQLPLSLISNTLIRSYSDDSYSETLIFSIQDINIDMNELLDPIISIIQNTYYLLSKGSLNWEQHEHDWQITMLLIDGNRQIYQYFQITLTDSTVYINHISPNI